jgi:hypothetical protein
MCVLNLHTRISLYFVVVVGDFNMRILHTNDVHAHVEQFDVHTSLCNSDDADNNRCYGGVARRQSAVDTMRRNHDNVVLLDAGDEFQGTIWYNYYKGRAASHFMDILGYDAMVSAYRNILSLASFTVSTSRALGRHGDTICRQKPPK